MSFIERRDQQRLIKARCMKIMNFFLAVGLGATIAVAGRIVAKPVEEPNKLPVVRTEAMICGHPKAQQYVDQWTVVNNYVVDLNHGGVYESWFCRPIDKDMAINTGIGRD